MTQKVYSRLSYKRIFLSLCMFAGVRGIAEASNLILKDYTISYTFAINFIGWMMVIYDWNLFAIHYNRFKKNPRDGFLFTIIGIVLLALWNYINQNFLHGFTLFPDPATIHAYPFALPVFLLAYTYIWAVIIAISFKCTTDHFDIRDKELLIILSSGFVFGLIYTLLFASWTVTVLVPTYLYSTVQIIILSYLYNQSSSLIPGILAMGTVTLISILMIL